MAEKSTHRHSRAVARHSIQPGSYQRLDLEDAHALLPMVRGITRRAVLELNPLQQRLNSLVPADPRNASIKAAYEAVVRNWAGKIERLGLKVHGLWQVGFDGGCGWYGWQYPERTIRYFLEYDALFTERCLIREHLQEQDWITRR